MKRPKAVRGAPREGIARRGKSHRPKPFAPPGAERDEAVRRIISVAGEPIDRELLTAGLVAAAANFHEMFFRKEAATGATRKEAKRICKALENIVQDIEGSILKNFVAFDTSELRQALKRIQAYVQFDKDTRDPRIRKPKGRRMTKLDFLIADLRYLHAECFRSRGTAIKFVRAALKELVEPECDPATIDRAFAWPVSSPSWQRPG